jgi:hypothetical protein
LLSLCPLLPPSLRRAAWTMSAFKLRGVLHQGYASRVIKVGGWGGVDRWVGMMHSRKGYTVNKEGRCVHVCKEGEWQGKRPAV